MAVSGALTLPAAAFAFGRLAGLRFPAPALLAVATLPFLFYRGYSIYGGNLASTLAGEFAFSMSLSLGLVYLGVVIRGLETGRHRALAAVLLALTGLCHIIPAFWVLLGTAVLVLLRWRLSRVPPQVFVPLLAGGSAAVLAGVLLRGVPLLGPTLLVLGGLGLAAGLWLGSESARWAAPTLAVGGLLSAFWVVPFALRANFVNDMGWEKLGLGDGPLWDRWHPYLLPTEPVENDLRWFFALALVGAVLSIVLRVRAGIFLAAMVLVLGVAFVWWPEGRLWNGRILPFYYLAALLLAFLAVALVIQMVGRRVRQGTVVVHGLGVLGTLLPVLLFTGLPLGAVWLSEHYTEEDPDSGEQHAGYRWPEFSPWQFEASPESFLPDWADWNFSGYEEKPSYREYHDIVATMERLGEENGCGRALWEYESELDRYGTPMALMLLPYWTDGCIGSMEGLFFEASMTTPYHFLMQTELSAAPSSAQRDMPYDGFDMDLGVRHLQLMGVRYYMALSPQAITAARDHPDLTEIASSGPWEVFEVAGTELVTPLDNEPAVLSGVGHGAEEWIREPLAWPDGTGGWIPERPEGDTSPGRYFGPSVAWFLDPSAWDVPVAVDGPERWQRVEPDEDPAARPVPPAEVSDVHQDRDRISFRVDEVGSPVLVKASYFPNWDADGAEGPWRVAPNLMVVVPTDEEVVLHYGRTPVEWFAYVLTAAGVAGLVMLLRRGRFRFGAPLPAGLAGTWVVDRASGHHKNGDQANGNPASGEPVPPDGASP